MLCDLWLHLVLFVGSFFFFVCMLIAGCCRAERVSCFLTSNVDHTWKAWYQLLFSCFLVFFLFTPGGWTSVTLQMLVCASLFPSPLAMLARADGRCTSTTPRFPRPWSRPRCALCCKYFNWFGLKWHISRRSGCPNTSLFKSMYQSGGE